MCQEWPSMAVGLFLPYFFFGTSLKASSKLSHPSTGLKAILDRFLCSFVCLGFCRLSMEFLTPSGIAD